MAVKRTEEENSMVIGGALVGSVIGAVFTGTGGAVVGGIFGALVGEYLNDEKRKKTRVR